LSGDVADYGKHHCQWKLACYNYERRLPKKSVYSSIVF
jgi:hypothetical protein